MLVLGRRVGESIMIGDNIKIVVLEIFDGSCRIGIDAPRNVSIIRDNAITKYKKDESDARISRSDRE